jgi:protein-L-isoaspartate(D-aspartate) O-methyltransferase
MSGSEDFSIQRKKMVDIQLAARGISDKRVLEAFGKVPRERFVRAGDYAQAYGDHPLGIGSGQTISQPYMVALMTQCLGLHGDENVLEIGTGSGYQTAILAELASKIYTVERIPELSERAQEILGELGYSNIRFRVSDGTIGWPEEAPYDAVIVTAGAPSVPESLKEQLIAGGRMSIPVGDSFGQDLLLVRKKDGRMYEEEICKCTFVKLIGEEGWRA